MFKCIDCYTPCNNVVSLMKKFGIVCLLQTFTLYNYRTQNTAASKKTYLPKLTPILDLLLLLFLITQYLGTSIKRQE